MFRETNKHKQLDLQSCVAQQLDKSSYKIYSDTTLWHNVFFKNVTSKIDETKFKCLYNDHNGAPNSSIRLLIAMMILKEGRGWSDQDLFEESQFNLLVRKALGLPDIKEVIPCASTYYLLRKRIVAHEKSTQTNLFSEIFKSVTESQIIEFEVSGKSIRMDSKLIGSNIAYYSRYELIHKTLLLYLRNSTPLVLTQFTQTEQQRLSELLEEDSAKTIYRSSKDVIFDKLVNVGYLIFKILGLENQNKTSQEYLTLKTVFEQQYNPLENEEIEVRRKEEISAQSIQSPYDTECTYRKKNEEVTKGYSQNITETCNKEGLNLITDIECKPASAADCDFLVPAANNTQELFEETIENIHTDGAYHSPENQSYSDLKEINLYCTAMQGAVGRYDLSSLAEGESYIIDNKTNEKLLVTTTPNNTYRISTINGYRYFNEQAVSNSVLRKNFENLPQEIKNIRNNVEASIFQLAFHLRKDRTRYRGLIKNKMWAIARCLWINCARITKYIGIIGQNLTNITIFIDLCYNYLILLFCIFSRKKLRLLESNGFFKN